MNEDNHRPGGPNELSVMVVGQSDSKLSRDVMTNKGGNKAYMMAEVDSILQADLKLSERSL